MLYILTLLLSLVVCMGAGVHEWYIGWVGLILCTCAWMCVYQCVCGGVCVGVYACGLVNAAVRSCVEHCKLDWRKVCGFSLSRSLWIYDPRGRGEQAHGTSLLTCLFWLTVYRLKSTMSLVRSICSVFPAGPLWAWCGFKAALNEVKAAVGKSCKARDKKRDL